MIQQIKQWINDIHFFIKGDEGGVYNEQNKETLNGIEKNIIDIEAIEEMKNTPAWKIIEGEIKEEITGILHNQIKTNPHLLSLFNILKKTDTKNEIDSLYNLTKDIVDNINK